MCVSFCFGEGDDGDNKERANISVPIEVKYMGAVGGLLLSSPREPSVFSC